VAKKKNEQDEYVHIHSSCGTSDHRNYGGDFS